MQFSVEQIAQLVGGVVEGDGSQMIHTIAKIQEGEVGAISFLANPKYEPYIYKTASSVVLVSTAFEAREAIKASLIRVEDPYAAFASLLEEYDKLKKSMKVGVEQPSFIAESATVPEDVFIGAFAYIGENVALGSGVKVYPHAYIGEGTTLGEGTIVYAGAKIYPDTQIGKNCVIHAGAVIGSDGFGFAPQEDGSYKTVPQLGNVILEDNVSIGANTTVDCATMGSTLIEDGVKIDNLVQIAHNVIIRKNTVIAAQTGISGSTEIGEQCVLAGQVGLVGHIKIGDKTTIGAQTGVTKSHEEGNQMLLGSPAYNIRQTTRILAVSRQLPDLKQRVDKIEKQLKKGE
ncbi:MAG: UDP-3-O-(3-hydroxymyristoyl)glucosamine N-acyltransferase [Bacteroidota bacterium]